MRKAEDIEPPGNKDEERIDDIPPVQERKPKPSGKPIIKELPRETIKLPQWNGIE